MVMKQEKSRKIEILAPAGSMEGLRAAVAAGADAVYMGGSRFGARAFADNPDMDGMLSAIDYAHFYDKKLYMTVNTLLKPDEMGDVLYRYLKPYYEAGLDAVIVQDAGVAEFVSREFPGLPLHASTQMSLVAAEGAECFQNYPVTRLVPARELGLSELKRLRASTKLEIETFVHGALCYCYSGQCLMSSMLGGRSGNRGRCAQPCRMEYEVRGAGEVRENGTRQAKTAYRSRKTEEDRRDRGQEGTAGSYLLSPKDMCTLDMIPELIEAGIDSFKIEGRMKRPEYAAGTAAAYRAEVQRYLELGAERYKAFHREHPEVLRQELLDMQDLYNRGGFSNGYYRMHNGRSMMSVQRPNHSGVYAAEVRQVRKNRAVLCAAEKLNAQDVLEIRLSAGGVYEFTLKEAKSRGEQFETNFLPGLKIRPGDAVFRTRNNLLLAGLSERCCGQRPRRGIAGCLEARAGEPLRLSVRLTGREELSGRCREEAYRTGECPKGTKMPEDAGKCPPAGGEIRGEWLAFAVGDIVEEAQKQPVTEERLRAQLEKTRDTPFYFAQLEIRCSGSVFVPVAKLNELRREALTRLEQEIIRRGRRKPPERKNSGRGGRNEGRTAAEKNKSAAEEIRCSAEDALKTGGAAGTGRSQISVTDSIAAPKNGGAADTGSPAERERDKAGPYISAAVLTREQFAAVLESGRASRIYYDIAAMPLTGLSEAARAAHAAGAELFVRLPQICRADVLDLLRREQQLLLSSGADGYLLRSYEELRLFGTEWKQEVGTRQLVTDAMLYTMNAEAKRFFAGAGAGRFTAPYELNARELAQLGIGDMELTVYGRLPLMTSAQCVRKNTAECLKEKGQGNGRSPDKIRNADCPQAGEDGGLLLTDRKCREMPVISFCRFCYSTIYSADCLWLADCESELAGLAPCGLRYDFTTESGRETAELLSGSGRPQGNFMRGHFFRGVQ